MSGENTKSHNVNARARDSGGVISINSKYYKTTKRMEIDEIKMHNIARTAHTKKHGITLLTREIKDMFSNNAKAKREPENKQQQIRPILKNDKFDTSEDESTTATRGLEKSGRLELYWQNLDQWNSQT